MIVNRILTAILPFIRVHQLHAEGRHSTIAICCIYLWPEILYQKLNLIRNQTQPSLIKVIIDNQSIEIH